MNRMLLVFCFAFGATCSTLLAYQGTGTGGGGGGGNTVKIVVLDPGVLSGIYGNCTGETQFENSSYGTPGSFSTITLPANDSCGWVTSNPFGSGTWSGASAFFSYDAPSKSTVIPNQEDALINVTGAASASNARLGDNPFAKVNQCLASIHLTTSTPGITKIVQEFDAAVYATAPQASIGGASVSRVSLIGYSGRVQINAKLNAFGAVTYERTGYMNAGAFEQNIDALVNNFSGNGWQLTGALPWKHKSTAAGDAKLLLDAPPVPTVGVNSFAGTIRTFGE